MQYLLLDYVAYVRSRQAQSPSTRCGWVKVAATALLRHTKIPYSSPRKEAADIVFLHHYMGGAERIRSLASRLERYGLVVRHVIVPSARDMILRRRLMRPPAELHPDLLLQGAYARYLVHRYEPKVLVTFHNGLLLAPFLREEMRARGVYVNISHGVTPIHHNHSVTAYNYYFLFGQSSLENLRRNPVRIGTTAAVLAGSPFVSSDLEYFGNDEADPRKVLFFSTWFPAGEYYEYLSRTAEIVVEWARRNPNRELYVKLHPLENPGFMNELTLGIPNIRVLPKSTPMQQALQGKSIVLHAHSNASLEAALAGKPSVLVNDSNVPDNYLHLEEYFLPRAANVEEINDRLTRTVQDYDYFVQQARRFVRFHLERTADSVPYIADCLVRLARGEALRNSIHIPQETAGLGRSTASGDTGVPFGSRNESPTRGSKQDQFTAEEKRVGA